MLSKGQIERMIDSNANERLIRRVLANGRGIDSDALLAWLDRMALHVVAKSLAIQRLDELTYGPEPTIRRLGRAILSLQRSDGLWTGDTDAARAIATAGAVNALCRMRDRAVAIGQQIDRPISDAIERGISALRWLHDATDSFSFDEAVREIVEWMLEPSLHDDAAFKNRRDATRGLFAHAA